MRITFCIHYDTAPGERVEVDLAGRSMPLDWVGGGWWCGEAGTYRGAPYTYRIVGEGAVVPEPGPLRHTPAPAGNTVTVLDRWHPGDPTAIPRRSALFRRAVAAHHPPPSGTPPHGHTFRVLAPEVPPGLRPAVVGSDPVLGGWDEAGAVAMSPSPFPWWQVSVDPVPGTDYKYVLVDDSGTVVVWETGENRHVPSWVTVPAVVNDESIGGLPGWRGAGVAVPVFSLRTRRSVGVGQFTDLIPLVDWAADAGVAVVQILPVNDTTKTHDWGDSYPYDIVTVRALHPVYIDLDDLGVDEISAEVVTARGALEAHPEVAFEDVMKVKLELLRTAYRSAFRRVDTADAFVRFVEREWEWLGPYAMWCVLRDRHGNVDHATWGADRQFDADRLAAMQSPGSATRDELRFHCWVQYHLHRQLSAAATHARSRGIAIKGDLPIGVSPASVETWTRPDLFHLGAQAGAPPDAFAVNGQNWGFPTYDWERMAADGYAWWQSRFRAMSDYVDVYRIDHVLGFFRIWEVPPDAVDGLLGRFRPCLPLTTDELVDTLGDGQLDRLLRPTIDDAVLAAKFGTHAGMVRSTCLVGTGHDLRLAPGFTTQRDIVTAFETGAFSDVDDADRLRLERGLLDIAADVMMMEVDGGYHPRISWDATETYRRMSDEQRGEFDALATHFFHYRHSRLWEATGRASLPAVIEATDMLACGEDLGMVPDFVPGVMNELGLLSLEIERMPKALGAWISDPGRAPYLSVVSPGTHDTSPLRQWWEEDRETITRYWNAALGRWGDPPDEASPEIIEAVVRRHLASPAMLCIIPLTDLLAIDESTWRSDGLTERVNDPSDRHHNWKHRLHLTVEEMAAADGFNQRLRDLIGDADR